MFSLLIIDGVYKSPACLSSAWAADGSLMICCVAKLLEDDTAEQIDVVSKPEYFLLPFSLSRSCHDKSNSDAISVFWVGAEKCKCQNGKQMQLSSLFFLRVKFT